MVIIGSIDETIHGSSGTASSCFLRFRSAKAEVVLSKRQAKKTEDTKAEQGGDIIATLHNYEAEEPGPVTSTVFPTASALAPVLAWLDKVGKGEELDDSEEAERAKLEKSLREFFDKGTKAEDWITAVADGIR